MHIYVTVSSYEIDLELYIEACDIKENNIISLDCILCKLLSVFYQRFVSTDRK